MNRRHRNILSAWQPAADIAMARPRDVSRETGGTSGLKINALSADTTEMLIYGDIGGWVWDGGVSAVDFAEAMRNVMTPNILVRINSRGGDAFDGVAIHSMLVNHSATVTTQVDGMAASAASIIAMAGDRIRVARHGMMMIHDAMTSTYGGPATHERSMNLLTKVSDSMADLYAMRTGVEDAEHWRNLMSVNGEDGTWFTGQECTECGMADEVMDQSDPEASARMRALLAQLPGAPTLPDEPEPEELAVEQVTSDMRGREQALALLAAFTFGS